MKGRKAKKVSEKKGEPSGSSFKEEKDQAGNEDPEKNWSSPVQRLPGHCAF